MTATTNSWAEESMTGKEETGSKNTGSYDEDVKYDQARAARLCQKEPRRPKDRWVNKCKVYGGDPKGQAIGRLDEQTYTICTPKDRDNMRGLMTNRANRVGI